MIPNMTIMAPKDENELKHMLFTALDFPGPVSIRYPRGNGVGVTIDKEYKKIPTGRAEVLVEGQDIIIFSIGNRVYPALEASRRLETDGLSAGVVNCRFVKPIDPNLVEMATKTGKVLIVEENVVHGGFGTAVLEFFSEYGLSGIKVRCLGLPDVFIQHGPQDFMRKKFSIDSEGIIKEAKKICS
jgi:1-deoxy-D-xylulose-5-phosphate synthase